MITCKYTPPDLIRFYTGVILGESIAGVGNWGVCVVESRSLECLASGFWSYMVTSGR